MTDKSNGAGPVAPEGPNDKVMQTFRMPRRLILFLKLEARQGGWDLTAQVVRYLEGIRTYFGLPEAATSLLDGDRKRLGMERSDYLLHVLYQRSLLLREQGAGFDAPNVVELKAAQERPR
jgi:hypothetical protein